MILFRTSSKRVTYLGALLAAWIVASQPVTLIAQVSPEEHASHHPGKVGGATPADGAIPAPAATPGGAGGMMEGMGKAPPMELYPSLMALPELSPEQRKQVEQQAAERMHAGTVLMAQALDTLNAGTQSGDYAAMHEAMTRLREGAAQLESGIAAHRALAEGNAPRNVALDWFKREMNLASPIRPDEPRALLGVTPFHLFTMVLLIAFALAMVAMYFFKMRRAAALFGRIEASKGRTAARSRHRRLPESAPPPSPAADGWNKLSFSVSEISRPKKPRSRNAESDDNCRRLARDCELARAASRGEHRHGNAKRENVSPPAFVRRPLPPFHLCARSVPQRRVLDWRRENEPLLLHLVLPDAARIRRADRAA